MEQIGKLIGKRKYEALKSLDLENISDEMMIAFNMQFPKLSIGEALKMIKSYEESFIHNPESMIKKTSDYFESINQIKPPKEKKVLTKEILWELFSKKYAEQNGVKYSKENFSIENLKPLIYYFIGDYENFKNCENVSKLSVPSFSKGLLIIGGYGNGKTSVMKALQSSLAYSNVSFRTKSTNEVVNMYEGCLEQFEKDEFWRLFINGTWNFDDLLSERFASNYGKVNIFKDIIELRYERMKRTYCTCNFDDRFPNNIEKGLEQFGEKYGSRVFDRIFSMFNIVEFKGNSCRR